MSCRKIFLSLILLVSAVWMASCSRVEKPSADDCKSAIGDLSGETVRDPKNIEIVEMGEYDKNQGWECKAILTEPDARKTGYIFYLRKVVKATNPDQTPKWRIVGATSWVKNK